VACRRRNDGLVLVVEVEVAAAAEAREDVAQRGGVGRSEAVETPFVGRDEEFELLLRRWQRAKSGEGQVVLLSGEAGIGKSKLLQGFQAQFGVDAHIILSLHGSPFHRNTMLYPVIENIQLAAKLLPQDADDERLEKLTAFLQPFNNSERMIPFLGRLLSLPAVARQSPELGRPELGSARGGGLAGDGAVARGAAQAD